MKVLFLDFDGVLNNMGPSAVYVNAPDWAKKRHPFIWIRDDLCKLLHEGLEKDIKIVISSTWRIEYHIKELQRILNDASPGLGEKIIDKTPVLCMDRGHEIKDWVQLFKPEKYVILDDNDDMLPEQLPFFVQTDEKTGLTKEDIKRINDLFHG